jgi:hypothetical protein
MLISIREKANRFQHRLTRLNNEPLSVAALVVILFLDFFILLSIFDGLVDHTGQLTTPDQYIPPLCREIVIDADWNPTNRLGHLATIVSKYHGSYYTPNETDEKKIQHAGSRRASARPAASAFRPTAATARPAARGSTWTANTAMNPPMCTGNSAGRAAKVRGKQSYVPAVATI